MKRAAGDPIWLKTGEYETKIVLSMKQSILLIALYHEL